MVGTGGRAWSPHIYGGLVDAILRWIIDVGLTIPPLLMLIVIASAVKGHLEFDQHGAGDRCARLVRAGAADPRAGAGDATGRLRADGAAGGRSRPAIIFLEILPNLLPFLMASLVLAISAAILSAVGLEALGLGPMDEPTLGMTVYWMMYYTAFMRGLWWWILAPIILLIILFVGLYLISLGLDAFANPRLRQRVAMTQPD